MFFTGLARGKSVRPHVVTGAGGGIMMMMMTTMMLLTTESSRRNNKKDNQIHCSSSINNSSGNNNNSNNSNQQREEYSQARVVSQSSSRMSNGSKSRTHYEYVIFGAGTAAHAALDAIRQLKPSAEVLMISDEVSFPRPDVEMSEAFRKLSDANFQFSSQALLGDEPSEYLAPELLLFGVYNEWRRHIGCRLSIEESSETSSSGSPPVTLMLARTPMQIDLENRVITQDDGTEVTYQKCLMATTGKPRRFYVLESDRMAMSLAEHINNLHDVMDFEVLAEIAKVPDIHVTVLGGGFLGTEIVSSLAMARKHHSVGPNVAIVFVEESILEQYIPSYLSGYITKKLQALGVEFIPNQLVTGVERVSPDQGVVIHEDDDYMVVNKQQKQQLPSDPVIDVKQQRIKSESTVANVAASKNTSSSPLSEQRIRALEMPMVGSSLSSCRTDYVVLASTKLKPNLQILQGTGIEYDSKSGGIVTNASLEAYNGFFVAGNAASYYDISLGRRRVDTYDHAVNSGFCAGQNMVRSQNKVLLYSHQPSFRSVIHGTGLTLLGLGEIDSRLHTVGVWLSKGNFGHESPLSSNSSKSSENNNYMRGVIYYLRDGKVVGILLCNSSETHERAREILREQKIVEKPLEDLKHKILLAPEHWLDVITTPPK